jgi:hypothetical protein
MSWELVGGSATKDGLIEIVQVLYEGQTVYDHHPTLDQRYAKQTTLGGR